MLNKLFCCFLFILSFNFSFSQERFGSTEKALNKLKKGTLQVGVGTISKEMDETFKSALTKYWNFCPLEYIQFEELDKDKPALILANFEINSWTHYTFTKMTFTNTIWQGFSCHFDNLTIKGQCLGIDDNTEAMKYKTNLGVLSLCAQVKFLDNAYTENKTKGINSWEGYKERLKTTTVLIPEEYLSNGLTKNTFKKIKKHEFVSTAEINKRINENNTKGYSVLNTYKCVDGSFFNIIDLETGDYIYRHDFGRVFEKGMAGGVDKLNEKEIIKIIEKMNE